MLCIGAEWRCAAATNSSTVVVERRPAQREHVARLDRRAGQALGHAGVGDHRAVARAPHRHRHVGAAAHLDDFLARLEAGPAAGGLVAVRVRRVELLEVDVLHVGPGVGEAPGEVFVLPEHDKRQARHRGAGDAVARRLDAREVPQRRRGQPQVRVVGDERLAGFAAAARDDPVVRADAVDAGRARRGVDQRHGLRAEPAVHPQALVERRVVDQRGRLVARVGRQQFVDTRHRQLQRQPHAQQFVAPVAAQVPGHHDRPGHAVLRRPRHGRHAEDQELRRPGFQALRQEGVDAFGVGQHRVARRALRLRPLRRRRLTDLQRTQEAVAVQRAGAEGLGEPAAADALVRLELPEPVLRMHEAQRIGRVVFVRGADGGNAVGVALDAHLACQARRAQVAVGLRQHAPRIHRGSHQAGQQQHDDQAQPPAQPTHCISSRFGCRSLPIAPRRGIGAFPSTICGANPAFMHGWPHPVPLKNSVHRPKLRYGESPHVCRHDPPPDEPRSR
jgi:hypothetical protein